MLFQFSLRDGQWCQGDYFLGLRGVYTSVPDPDPDPDQPDPHMGEAVTFF
jgi:hypothetical protein